MAKNVTEINGLRIGDIAFKVLEGPDDMGDLKVSYKVDVKNVSHEDPDVYVRFQGLDSDGFKVEGISVSGRVGVGETETLTDWQYFSDNLFKSVVRWRVE